MCSQIKHGIWIACCIMMIWFAIVQRRESAHHEQHIGKVLAPRREGPS